MNNDNNMNNMNNFNNANNVVGQPVNNNNNNNKKGMISKILIGMLIGFLVCIGGIVVISLTTDIDSPDDYDNSNNYNDVDNANAKRLYIFKGKTIQGEDYYKVVEKKEKISEDYSFITEYVCSSLNCAPIEWNGSTIGGYAGVVVADGDKYAIFDAENNKKIITPIEVNEDYHYLYLAENKKTKEIYGLVANAEDYLEINNKGFNSKYYSIKYNKVIENKDYIYGIYKDKYMITYGRTGENNDDTGCISTLVDIATGKTLNDKTLTNQHYEDIDDYILLYNSLVNIFDIYGFEFKVLDENLNFVSNKYYDEIIEQDNSVYLYNNTKDNNTKGYDVYNKTTKKLTNVNLNFDILSIIKDKVVVKGRNNYLTVLDMNGKVLKEISDIDLSKNDYDFSISKYYEAHDDKKAGLYFILRNNVSGKCFEYFFDNDTYETIRYDLEECYAYAKPVLYLYPTEETKVTVDFEHENMLTTTYPKFNKKWTVIAKPNGDLYDENGKYYYALYWEEKKNHDVNFNVGFYVEKENAIEFLEEKLEIIGLNDREKNEFIMYWLPILEKNEKNLVYFELTEERDSYNKINISPKPDSILRVAMHVKKVDKKINIKEQILTPFNREGFVAVEWGGVSY